MLPHGEDPDEVSSAEEVDSIDPEKPIQEAEVGSFRRYKSPGFGHDRFGFG